MDIVHDPITAGMVKTLVDSPVAPPNPIGGVIQMSSSIAGPLVVHGEATYLKNGSFIDDGAAEYPDAFTAMTPNVTASVFVSTRAGVKAALIQGNYLYESYSNWITITDIKTGVVKNMSTPGSYSIFAFVASGGNIFTVVGNEGPGNYYVYQVDSSGVFTHRANTSVPYSANMIPAVANGVLVISNDQHASAVSLTTFAVTNSSAVYNQTRSVVAVNNVFVALCTGLIYHSVDGTVWTGVSTPSQANTEIAYVNGLYYRRATTNVIYTSPDLTTWTVLSGWTAYGLFGFNNSIYSWGADHVIHKLVGSTWVNQILAGATSGNAANYNNWIATPTYGFFKGIYVNNRGFIGIDPYSSFRRVASGTDFVVIETAGTRVVKTNSVGIPAKAVPDGLSNFLRVK